MPLGKTKSEWYFFYLKEVYFTNKLNLTKLFWSTLIPDTFCQWKDINNFWVFFTRKIGGDWQPQLVNSQRRVGDAGISPSSILKPEFPENSEVFEEIGKVNEFKNFQKSNPPGFPLTSPLPAGLFEGDFPNFPFGGIMYLFPRGYICAAVPKSHGFETLSHFFQVTVIRGGRTVWISSFVASGLVWVQPPSSRWWLNQPIWKNISQIGSFPLGSGWK